MGLGLGDIPRRTRADRCPLDCVDKTSIVVVAPKISRGWGRVDINESTIDRELDISSFVRQFRYTYREIDCYLSLLKAGDHFSAMNRDLFFFSFFK